ncbi:hypothetical protein Pdw03_3794 [Penicillium digitatum]|uniref:Uncharacterized protein n=1 Tax=Penicillium digitatum TaxID=36651 RepID=A0A7T7BIF4_PENDI|nr:hypothetical protein Pdw03_3794 [Penicillium digitatum]
MSSSSFIIKTTTYVTAETVVAGTISVLIDTALSTTAPGAVHTSSVPVQTTTAVAPLPPKEVFVVGETGVSHVSALTVSSVLSAPVLLDDHV